MIIERCNAQFSQTQYHIKSIIDNLYDPDINLRHFIIRFMNHIMYLREYIYIYSSSSKLDMH